MDSVDASALSSPQVLLSTITEKLRSVLGIDEVDILTEYIMHLLSHNRATFEDMCKELREFLGEQAESFVEWVLELVNSQHGVVALASSLVDAPSSTVYTSVNENRDESLGETAKFDSTEALVVGKKEQDGQKLRLTTAETRRCESQRSRMLSLAVKQAALTTSTPVLPGKRGNVSLPDSTSDTSTTDDKRRKMEESMDQHFRQEGRLVSRKLHAEESRKLSNLTQPTISRSVFSETVHLTETDRQKPSDGIDTVSQAHSETASSKDISMRSPVCLTAHSDAIGAQESNNGRVRLVESTKATSIYSDVSDKSAITTILKEKSKVVLTPNARFLSHQAYDASWNEAFVPYTSEIVPEYHPQGPSHFYYEAALPSLPSHGFALQSMGPPLSSDASSHHPHNTFPKQFPASSVSSSVSFVAGHRLQTSEYPEESPAEITKWTSTKLLGDEAPSASAFPLGKVRKRCVNWPNCSFGDKCRYIHPSEKCETWPNCLFGNECFYIHPEVSCKFGASCYNAYCNYAHPLDKANIQGFAKTRLHGMFVNQSISFSASDGSNEKILNNSSQIQFNTEVEKLSETMPSTPPSLKAQSQDLSNDNGNPDYANLVTSPPLLQLNTS